MDACCESKTSELAALRLRQGRVLTAVLAINAVMSGAKPEYFPVILALASTERTAKGSTTSSTASCSVEPSATAIM